MHRCACSTKALESFARDFAGINIRQQRAQLFFQHYRPLSTQSHLRQLDIPAQKKVDDVAHKEHPEESDGMIEAGATKLVKQESNPQSEPQTIGDAVLLGANDALSSSSVTLPKPASNPRTRVEGRLLRKLRRMRAGKYAPVTAKNEELQQVDDADGEEQMENVITRIDQLEGPSIIQQEAKRKQRLAEKSAEKKKEVRQARVDKKREEAEKAKKEQEERERQRRKQLEPWQRDKEALKEKFKNVGWQPRKRLSPDSLEGIRALHTSNPATYTTPVLSEHFKVSPESIRRILKSKWQPSEGERANRMERWEQRGVKKWEEMSVKGMKPPKKWRMLGVQKPVHVPKKKWEDLAQARESRMKTAAAQDKNAWREELRRVTTSAEVTSLADRIL